MLIFFIFPFWLEMQYYSLIAYIITIVQGQSAPSVRHWARVHCAQTDGGLCRP